MPRTLFICFILLTTFATTSEAAHRCGTPCPPGLIEVKDCDENRRPPCFCTCEETSQALEISRFTTSTLTDADADQILADVGRVLSRKDGASDIACMLTLVRNGNVTVFDFGNGIINSQSDLDSLFGAGLPGKVRVINQISFCGGFKPNIIGCAANGTPQVVVRHTPTEEGILWAHEYGHTRNLPHRDSDPVAVMHPTIIPSHLQVTNGECKAFLK